MIEKKDDEFLQHGLEGAGIPAREENHGDSGVLGDSENHGEILPQDDSCGENSLAVQESEEKIDTPAKRKKEPKTFPRKKLPRMMKKKYSERKFRRKILRRIYIPHDREFIQSFFMPIEGKKRVVLAIPDDRVFTKRELVRLKSLSKEIRKQKGRIKLLPLFAAVGVVTALVCGVLIFKDPLIKKGLQIGLQSAFGAKVDIAYLHLGLLDSNFTIRGLAVTNKNDTMKNLFEIGGLTVDFDLIQLLKKRFVADEMSVSDVRVNTDRETDGALPQKEKEDSGMDKVKAAVTDFSLAKASVLQNSVTDIFAQYNPENLIENFYLQLSTPELVEEIEGQMNALISAWQGVPSQLTASVNKVIADGQEVANFNWNSIKTDPTQIRTAIATIKSVTDSATSLYEETEMTVNMLQRDVKQVQEMTANAQKALKDDFNLISKEVSKITSFSIKEDGMNILTTSFEKIIADLFGQYYPLFQEIMGYVQDLSAKSAEKKAAEAAEEKNAVQRYEGRTIEYRADNIPSFLIKKMHGSGADGNFSLSLDATDISSDMTKWGKPASLSGLVGHGNMTDSFSGTLDLRENRPGDLVDLNYKGSGYRVSLRSSEDIPGVPAGVGTGYFDARITANETGAFSVGGSVVLDPVSFTTASFEPAFAYNLYSRALAMFTAVEAGVTLGYSDATGLYLDLDTDLDRRFVEVLTTLFNEELAKVKSEVTARAQDLLNQSTGKITEKFGEFEDITSLIEAQKSRLENYKKELERKLKEGEDQLNAALNAAKDKAVDAAKDAASKAAESAKDKAQDAAKDALKGLFGR